MHDKVKKLENECKTKGDKIKELESIKYDNELECYYKIDSDGVRINLCPLCYGNKKEMPLKKYKSESWICPECKGTAIYGELTDEEKRRIEKRNDDIRRTFERLYI